MTGDSGDVFVLIWLTIWCLIVVQFFNLSVVSTETCMALQLMQVSARPVHIQRRYHVLSTSTVGAKQLTTPPPPSHCQVPISYGWPCIDMQITHWTYCQMGTLKPDPCLTVFKYFVEIWRLWFSK